MFFIKGFIADSQALAEEGCGSYLILHPTPRLSQHGGQVTEQPVLSHCQPFSGKPLTLTQRSPKTQLQVPSSFPPTHRPHKAIVHTATARAFNKANDSVPFFKIHRRLPFIISVPVFLNNWF